MRRKPVLKDNDWIEVCKQEWCCGCPCGRKSQNSPRSGPYVPSPQDRTVNVPISETTKQVGGSHNAPTKIHVKPTHAVGGYAQLAYGFNYYGPTGTQRDEVVYIRKLERAEFSKVEV